MCTIGYSKKLNVLFKNRDKNVPVEEVLVLKPDFTAVKTEGANYFSLGNNKHSVSFVSAAINTPLWTSIASKGDILTAKVQFEKENKGLFSPIAVISKHLDEVVNIKDMLDLLLNSGLAYMGYNIILADRFNAAHVELYKNDYELTSFKDDYVSTNHFKKLDHGPKAVSDYPDSFDRLSGIADLMPGIVSIEDMFEVLKSQREDHKVKFWREGTFFTESSSVIDIENCAIYYTADPKKSYSRISSRNPLKSKEKAFLEMSRYIDLPTYHNIEKSHPFYIEMLDEIKVQLRDIYENHNSINGNDKKLEVLEIGAGTGLCSLELNKLPFINLNCLEIDENCCKVLLNHPEAEKYNVINDDAVTFCKPNFYDVIISTFAHDHIHYDMRYEFSKNLHNNLKEGGSYIVGGEMLPYFSNDLERKRSLFRYHNYIIDLALSDNRVLLSELENNALKSGLDMIGDFKRHEIMFEEEMEKSGFFRAFKKKIGPDDRADVGGVFVYVYAS